MNTAEYVGQYIEQLKNKGIPLADAAWEAALACVGWPYIYGDRGQYCTPSHREAVFNKYPEKTSLRDKCQALKSGKSCSGCKWYPGGKRVRSFDCRGFTYWILLQIYGWKLMGAGATSQWNTESNWKAKGLIETIPEDTLVCLFYRDKDNPKVMAHTGFGYKGETCECSNGVQHFQKRDKKWEFWAVPACVEGDVIPGIPAEPEPGQDRPTIRKGSRGEAVTECQEILVDLGYDIGASGIDGVFGAKTEAAVKLFQKRHGLTADGIVGPRTWEQLAQYQGEEPETYTVTIKGLTKEQAEEICREWSGASMKRE